VLFHIVHDGGAGHWLVGRTLLNKLFLLLLLV